jgi:endoglucanase
VPDSRSISIAVLVTAAIAVIALAAAVPADSGAAARGPLAGARLYAAPNSAAAQQVAAWQAQRPADAAQIAKLAAQPQASWFGTWVGPDEIAARVGAVARAASAARQWPALVAYDMPRPGQPSQPDPAATYVAWIRGFARGIGHRHVIVVVEPDALAQLGELSAPQRAERRALLRTAVRALTARPHALVYIDAGHERWHPPAEIARWLRQVGVARAAGFSLNVANFDSTASEVAYGRAISKLIGGKGFVIDTSRNGRGPLPGQWCNPPGRALGRRPVVAPARGVDAYLWVKGPGFSDGTCNGGPPAGTWWPEYALGLAQRAKW